MIALVTGGAGFIGSHIVDDLVNEGVKVRVLDNLTTGRVVNLAASMRSGHVKFLKGSITDWRVVRAAARGTDSIFHQAALVSVPRSYKNPRVVHKVNTEGTINLLETSRRYDVEHFVYASSSSLYGETEHAPVNEDAAPRPISPYGASKLAAEEYCQAYWRAYGLSTVSLRYFNVYGPRQTGGAYSGVIATFARAISSGKPPILNGDGGQVRDFVYVSDVSHANVQAAGARGVGGEIFNIGTGKATSIDELARAMLSLSGRPHVGLKYATARTGDISYSCANVTKAISMLGYKPRTKLKEGIVQVLNWYGKEVS